MCLLSAKSLAFLYGIYLALINNCMNLIKKKPKRDLLSHAQHAMNTKQKKQTTRTDEWLSKQGISTNMLLSSHPQLLKAQQAAHHLLKYHQHFLSADQRRTLEKFQRQMNNKHSREKLKPQAAFPILNISSKINRQFFSSWKEGMNKGTYQNIH